METFNDRAYTEEEAVRRAVALSSHLNKKLGGCWQIHIRNQNWYWEYHVSLGSVVLRVHIGKDIRYFARVYLYEKGMPDKYSHEKFVSDMPEDAVIAAMEDANRKFEEIKRTMEYNLSQMDKLSI